MELLLQLCCSGCSCCCLAAAAWLLQSTLCSAPAHCPWSILSWSLWCRSGAAGTLKFQVNCFCACSQLLSTISSLWTTAVFPFRASPCQFRFSSRCSRCMEQSMPTCKHSLLMPADSLHGSAKSKVDPMSLHQDPAAQ